MLSPEILNVANHGDAVAGADLQASIDRLKAMAAKLDSFKSDPSATVGDIQEIGRTQADLHSKAVLLNVAQIDLLVGEVKVTAEHINAAVAYSDGVVDQIADWRKRIVKIGALLSFVATIPGGRGNEILQAANTLKKALAA